MSENSRGKVGVLLLGMGGPKEIDDVRQYLVNIFSDREIIKLPGGPLLQKPLARLIARMRTDKVQGHYRLIGGGSPLLRWTLAQKELLERKLKSVDPQSACFVGMRYFYPTIREALAEAYQKGFKNILLLPLYPQFCRATTGSSFIETQRAAKDFDGIQIHLINDFHDDQGYVALLKDHIGKYIKPDETLLFSAHSIPVSFVAAGDPYVEQVKKTAQLAAEAREYFVSFQSRTGPVKWVGPDTINEARRLVNENRRLFIVPISFVCDHIETLYEIDIELKQLLGEPNSSRIRRMPMFNDDPRFAEVLFNIVKKRIVSHVSA